ncbi:ABC transporter permease [Lachnotalea sp. AF33-28]|jgi:ABC-type Na+ efflux pump permease subunit|uniref:ABC transporter permease n=1 Tax=Lachnotalea sp. AF33-28 TaxID=2292046 RepID=UPI000E513B06|nr:ABC transporter permease [Lachnotalea sp. AF33-28]RHP36170.1 ABC transporter permease [Lachnotalea sp. AF33-28]
MKKFLVVLQYELKEYVRNKSFVITTLLFAILGSAALFLPRVIDMSGFLGTQTPSQEEAPDQSQSEEADKETMLLYDQAGVMDSEVLDAVFPDAQWESVTDMETITSRIEKQEADAAFVVKSEKEYDYYVFNKGMYDQDKSLFETALGMSLRKAYCEANGLDFTQLESKVYPSFTANEQVLGKDTTSNYWYCYILVILVFMLIVFYGQMIAVAVTNEKSNRSIEVLVTTTTPNSLLFGKVIAGAIASLCQVGIILGAVLLSYQANRSLWGGMLDMVFNIPAEVLISFAFFGLGGYLFYAFLYGAMGALVSKTEDISKSSGGLMMVVMIVYFIALLQLTNVDGIAMKVLSFLPISSYSAMFVRIAMGTVNTWEIIVSFVILVASIFGAGILGAKIYRMGTLRYGNPIKLTAALKDLKKSE